MFSIYTKLEKFEIAKITSHIRFVFLRKTLTGLDCEQCLSFPSVFLAFFRASVELSSSERRSREARDANAFLSLICIILNEFCARSISGTKTTTRSL